MGHLRERNAAKKRGGDVRLLTIDQADAEQRWERVPNRELDPAVLFERAWALEVLNRAVAALEHEYSRRNDRRSFDALKQTLVPGGAPESHGAIAARLGISEGAVRVAAHRLRKSYRRALRAELRSTVERPEDADAEYETLMRSLSGRVSE